MVGFLGPNGAGKTTTLKMLSGLIFPSAGAVQVLGFVPQERSNDYRRQFALLMGQRNQLWWDLPAADSFRLHREIYAIEPAAFERTLGELTELLEVRGLLNQPVRELSLGERMKMELIAALLHAPKVLFLDEPTIGLDVVAQGAIRRCLREYNRRVGVTVLLTSHYMQDIEALCDRVLVINAGRLMHDGPLGDIVQRFAASKIVTLRFREGCIPQRELFDGVVVAYTPPTVQLRLERDGIAGYAARLLARFDIQDISVEDPPIEEVVARLFAKPQPGQEAMNEARR
jgi:ABC-2 type transport system ATP-binding protein